jgi:hypothetical protein
MKIKKNQILLDDNDIILLMKGRALYSPDKQIKIRKKQSFSSTSKEREDLDKVTTILASYTRRNI